MDKSTQSTLKVPRFDVVMEGADMRAVVLTLAAGECVPWHYHSNISDKFFCLSGPMIVETRAPRTINELQGGDSCIVEAKTTHYVHGKGDGSCRFLVLQGVGVYDNVPVG